MRIHTTIALAITFFAVLSVAISSADGGLIWHESGDAGDLPSTSQITVGRGPLSSIRGKLTDIDDIDFFAIEIPDLFLFSATTVSVHTEFIDTQLFLFDEDGFGVLANDDTSFGIEGNATLPAGRVTGSGIYYLAVAEFADKPVSSGGKIFPDLFTIPPASFDDVVGPTGPGGASPIIGWDTDGFTQPFAESYEIILSGANPAVVPEPSSIVLWGLGLGGILVLGTRHRRSHRPLC